MNLYDGMPLAHPDFPLPHRRDAVLRSCAAQLGASPRNAAVLSALEERFDAVSLGSVAVRTGRRHPTHVQYDARHHPSGMSYSFGALTRITAHLLDHPQWIADSWSAAALWGFGAFSDSADTCVLSSGRTTPPVSSCHARRRRLTSDIPLVRVSVAGRDITTVRPGQALIRCLLSALRGEHAWAVPPIPHLTPETVRAVQVVDHYRHVMRPDQAQLTASAHELLDVRTMHRLLRLSDGGAESPQETALRLATRGLPGVRLSSQMPVYAGQRLVTRYDLADDSLKLGVMYDGVHHWTRTQRERDARINLELGQLGWTTVRVSAPMLHDARHLRSVLSETVARLRPCT